MNKKCSHCNKDLFNKYVNACHLCFTRDNEFNKRFINEKVLSLSEKKKRYLSKTLPFPWKGKKEDLNNKKNFFNEYVYDMDMTEQKLDDGTIIIRKIKEYHTGFLGSIFGNYSPLDKNIGMSFREYIYLNNGEAIDQEWSYVKKRGDQYTYAGEGMYLLSLLIEHKKWIKKLKEDETYYNQDSQEVVPAKTRIFLSYKNWPAASYLSIARTDEVDINCYGPSNSTISDTPINIFQIFKFDGKCKSGKIFDRNGNLLYSFDNYNGYLINDSISLPHIYICTDGILKDYYSNDSKLPTWNKKYDEAYKYVMNLEDRKHQQKRDKIKREEYYEAVEELKEDFNPTQYHKNCPDCFEKIKLPATICHFCKRTFSDEQVESHIHLKLEDLKDDL